MPVLKIISEGRVPIKVWTDEVEESAMIQLRNTSNLPFVFKHVAVMPDVHAGVGSTIGSVIATKDCICPATVGVDIGCGMMAVKTDLDPNKLQDNLAKIRHSIERSIPVGFNKNKIIQDSVATWPGWDPWQYHSYVDDFLRGKALTQMGSLGGGNHFIEICLDTENNVWVMLHSGSRGVGNILAKRHIDVAKGIMSKYMISLPDPDLAYFAEKTPEFEAYYEDLMWAQGYALQNRVEMMSRCLKDLSYAIHDQKPVSRLFEVNCHHNYVEKEHHFGQNVFITRKGAVRARLGEYGIIPGSMGTKSYIVRGLGNGESFNSCSHGAGRRMSRTKARASFTVEDLALQTKGVECRKDKEVIDEIPGAYKSIETVMANQSDLVEIVHELRQVICIKG